MNLVLNYCWKEWRAQRALLISYTLLIFASLSLGLSMAPRHYWFDEGIGVHALAWFVAAGVIGVVAFVVPNLVLGEFTSKDDQLVRRLPGALWPAFGGKLLFLVLATLLLPLLGLLVGEIFVTTSGYDWSGLFVWRWDGGTSLEVPVVIVGCGIALLMVPWIWAAGMWTPGGRLSLLAAVLLALVVGVAVFAVLRQCPNMGDELPWLRWSWAWTVPVVGIAVAALSWVMGRRGGGALRSARFGLLATTVAILPGAVLLGERAWHYHYPDLGSLRQVRVTGLSPDGRFALASVAERGNWMTVPIRIDLANGEAEQVAGVMTDMRGEVVRPYSARMTSRQRLWRMWSPAGQRLFDLCSATWLPVGYDAERRDVLMSSDLRAEVFAELRAQSQWSAPGGVRVWIEGDEVCFGQPDGLVEREPWPCDPLWSVHAAGHGLLVMGSGATKFYNLVTRSLLEDDTMRNHLVVDQCLLFTRFGGRAGQWHLRIGDGEEVTCDELQGARVHGLLDDHRVLASRASAPGSKSREFFVFEPATGVVAEVEMPENLSFDTVYLAAPMFRHTSIMERDPANHVWLAVRRDHDMKFVRIDAQSLRASALLPHRIQSSRSAAMIMSWSDWPRIVLHDGLEIVRVNVETGERTVLFPR